MDKQIVVYFSRTGSNDYLAKRLSSDLGCECVPIRPRISAFFIMLMSRWLGFGIGIRPISNDLGAYRRVILVGPVWMGNLIAPLRSFIRKYRSRIRHLSFVTCCASGFGDKDGKWGHERVFAQVRAAFDKEGVDCTALPIPLVVPEDKRDDNDLIMQTRLSDENFHGEIKERYTVLLDWLRSYRIVCGGEASGLCQCRY